MKIFIVLAVLLPTICFGVSVVRTIDAPDTNISGLAWGEDKLWALDEESSFIYGINPVTGSIEESFEITGTPSNYSPAGLTFQGSTLFSSFVNGGGSSYIYFYSSSGNYLGSDCLC